MRCALILTMFAASLAHAAFSGFEETRHLDIDTNGLSALRIEAGGGKLAVTGDPGLQAVQVTATIRVPDADADKARQIMQKSMQLSLARDGDRLLLKSWFDDSDRWFGDSPTIDLEVRVPASMGLDVDDGSGSLKIGAVHGDIRIADGSGDVKLVDVGGKVEVDDGSGSLDIADVHGDLVLDDGSGTIVVRNVNGNVRINDGSGSIRISDVTGDLDIEDSGSGTVDYSQVQGRVTTDED